jgi:hypothetical protein
MADSVVDLGAAAVEGIGDFFSDAFDYMTGAPEASASEGYFINKNRRAQTYVGGERPEGQTFREYLGFENGGDVPLQDDGSLPGVDDLRFMTPAEVEEGSYAFLQDMEQQMMYHLSEAQNPANANKMGGVYADRVQHHYQEAEKLRDQIEQFKERRASAILNYPDSETKMYIKEGRAPYVRGFPDSLVEGYEEGGIAIPQEDMDQFVEFIQRNRPSYTEGETTEYRDFPILGMTPVQSPPKDIGPATGRGQGIGDLDFYEGFADPQFPIRPIEKQRFEQKRGFQMGTKIKLNDRDDAVGGKLLKQAGMQASANQVMENLDPRIVEQMSRILGRNIG